ncbi:SKP1-like protein 1A [Papaver somniferum]|uniref:SKP1-like protein 1A n=1 Tax=Papaver somniferum TaxID=3469 RepID=UPI000E704956|nr:SKP1-like protein 1A [Papaver somniferum]
MPTSETITLSSDGEDFVVEEDISLQSEFVKKYMRIPIPLISSKVLAKVVEYCKKHDESPRGDDGKTEEEGLKTWDAEFFNVDLYTFLEIMFAAKLLGIKNLEDFVDQKTATMIMTMFDNVKKIFGVIREIFQIMFFKRETAMVEQGIGAFPQSDS